MLAVGMEAPDFVFVGADQLQHHLRELLGKKVVLYFFPKAFTTGCTLETRQFRDHYDEFRKLGAEVLGVSVDEPDVQCSFVEKEKVPFTIVSDISGQIGHNYQALWPILGINQRVTYVINEDGKIGAVFHHEVRIDQHVQNVKRYLLDSSKNVFRPAAPRSDASPAHKH